MQELPTPDGIMQLGLGFWASKTFLSAVELSVFTELAKEPLDCDGLTKKLGLKGRGSCDFYDALVALGMLERKGGVYSNTVETDLFLDKAKPSYMGGIFEMAESRLYGFWGNLTKALKTGEPQNEIKSGDNIFEEFYSDPEKLKGFLHAMAGISAGPAMSIAKKFPWKDYKTFIDIGCAQGMTPAQIALANEHLAGGGFDLPPVGPVFEEFINSFGLGDRLQFTSGDFFNDPLPQADVLIMGHILHDWNMEEKRMLIDKCYKALPSGGALIVYGLIIDDDRCENAIGLLSSLNMLIETPGGFDYTGADCRGWLEDAGFKDTYVEPLVGPSSMVVGIK